MKFLVTGGAGFIGTNVCLEARERGHEVIAFDNFVRPQTEENIPVLEKAGVKIVRGDVRNPEDFEKFRKIDAIIHLAAQCGIPYAQVNPYYDFEVNLKGTINILEYSRTHGRMPVAFASSNKAYTDITNTLPMQERETRYEWTSKPYKGSQITAWGWNREGINELMPLDAFGKYARSLYGTSKVAADLYCQEYYQAFGVPTVVNRMSCIYGLYQKGTEDQAWADFFIRQILLGNGKINIFGTGKQVRDMLFGTDCARLYLDEIENIDKVKGQAYNIGGGPENTLSLLEAIAIIEELTSKKAKLTFLGKRYGDQDVWYSDITKITTDLPIWEPTINPREGIKLIIEQYKNAK